MDNILYKITLSDCNLPSFISGTYWCFVENLEDFEKNWLPLAAGDPIQVERYYKSKFGEVITDTFSDAKALNIVQSAKYKIIAEKKTKYKNKQITLANTYRYTSDYEFDSLVITQRVIKYGRKYYLVGQYEGKGCKRVGEEYNRWYNTEVKYKPMSFYGNDVAIYSHRKPELSVVYNPDAYKDYFTNDKEFFKYDSIETFVWLPIKEVTKDYQLKTLTQKEIAYLMRDIIGEAG